MSRAPDRARPAAASAPGAFVWFFGIFCVAALVGGCGGSPSATNPGRTNPATNPGRTNPATNPGRTDGGGRGEDGGTRGGGHDVAASDGLPSLDALAARGPTDAPLMREALRSAATSPRSLDVRADKDLCLRAVFAASAPARASFADESGATRGEATTGASGTVPPRGPVCMKKGEALHLVVESLEAASPATARAVIFAAP